MADNPPNNNEKDKDKVEGSIHKCSYCTGSFPTSEACIRHEKTAHIEDLFDDAFEPFRSSAGEGEPTSTRRANVRLAFKCNECHLSFATNAGLSTHYESVHNKTDQGEKVPDKIKCPHCPRKVATKGGLKRHITVKHKDHSVGDTSMVRSHQAQKEVTLSPVTFNCAKCDKRFLSADFLKNHMSTDHPILSCNICGEIFKTKNDMIQHKKQCGAKYHVGEDEENNTTARDDAYKIQALFAPPAAKRTLLTPVENRNLNSKDNITDGNQFALIVTPKRENVSDMIQGITVKTEAKNTSLNPQFTSAKPHRASTKSVYRSLGQTMGQMIPHSSNMNRASPMEHSERSEHILYQERHSMNSPASMTSGGLTSINRRPERLSNNHLAEDHVAMSSIPLTTAIMVRSQQETNDLMIVWTESVDVDILDTVRQNSGQAILCIRQLDMLSLTTQQTERLKKSNLFTFVMFDNNETCTIWTVVSFGEGHSFIGFHNRHFKQFTEVERIFAEHAHSRGMVINNAMRGDGLLNLLRDKLKEKKSVYNVNTI